MLNQTFTQYNGSTVIIDLKMPEFVISELENILVNFISFSSAKSLYKCSLNEKEGYEKTIVVKEGTTDTVTITIPAEITQEAETDSYNMAYAIIIDDEYKDVRKFKIEKYIKFEQLDV